MYVNEIEAGSESQRNWKVVGSGLKILLAIVAVTLVVASVTNNDGPNNPVSNPLVKNMMKKVSENDSPCAMQMQGDCKRSEWTSRHLAETAKVYDLTGKKKSNAKISKLVLRDLAGKKCRIVTGAQSFDLNGKALTGNMALMFEDKSIGIVKTETCQVTALVMWDQSPAKPKKSSSANADLSWCANDGQWCGSIPICCGGLTYCWKNLVCTCRAAAWSNGYWKKCPTVSNNLGRSLGPKESIRREQFLHNGNYMAKMQKDGNFVVYHIPSGLWLWATHTAQAEGPKFFVTLPSNNDLTVWDDWTSPSRELWSLPTNINVGQPGGSLEMVADGDLLLIDGHARFVWSPFFLGSSVHATTSADAAIPTAYYLRSPNGRYKVVMQVDGNLVVYESSAVFKATWASHTHRGAARYHLAMQRDNNLVIYNGATPIWHTHTHGRGVAPAKLIMQDDGNLVVYDARGSALWSSWHGQV